MGRRLPLLPAVWVPIVCGVGACAGPREIPFSGPAPLSILVGPVAVDGADISPAEALHLGRTIEAPLAGRGYRVPTWLDVQGELAAAGLGEALGSPEDLSREMWGAIGRAAHVDAVLTLVVHQWDVRWGGELDGATHDFEYVLHSTATGEVLWRNHSSGTYQRATRVDMDHIFPEPGPALTPVSGIGPVTFDDPEQALRAIHRWVMERLPRAR